MLAERAASEPPRSCVATRINVTADASARRPYLGLRLALAWMTDLPTRRSLPHAVPAWIDSGAVYFVTVCAARRGVNALCVPDVADRLVESVRFRHRHAMWDVLVLTLMPDHLHLLARFDPEPGMHRAITDWKRYTARTLGIDWQRDFFDHRIRNEGDVRDKAEYVRQNPVRAGLATTAESWPHTWTPDR